MTTEPSISASRRKNSGHRGKTRTIHAKVGANVFFARNGGATQSKNGSSQSGENEMAITNDMRIVLIIIILFGSLNCLIFG